MLLSKAKADSHTGMESVRPSSPPHGHRVRGKDSSVPTLRFSLFPGHAGRREGSGFTAELCGGWAGEAHSDICGPPGTRPAGYLRVAPGVLWGGPRVTRLRAPPSRITPLNPDQAAFLPETPQHEAACDLLGVSSATTQNGQRGHHPVTLRDATPERPSRPTVQSARSPGTRGACLQSGLPKPMSFFQKWFFKNKPTAVKKTLPSRYSVRVMTQKSAF